MCINQIFLASWWAELHHYWVARNKWILLYCSRELDNYFLDNFSWPLSYNSFLVCEQIPKPWSVPLPSQTRCSSTSNVLPSVFTCSGCSLRPSSLQNSCTANSAGAPTELQGQEKCYIKTCGKMLTWISIMCSALERNAARIFGNGWLCNRDRLVQGLHAELY